MSDETFPSSVQITDGAEGEPDDRERSEPVSPLHTATVPVLDDIAETRIGETGTNLIVRLGIEGDDNSDEQDASLTKDENKLSMSSDPDAAQNFYLSRDVPILIVEDTIELAEVIQATLENMGFTAVYETHGTTGLERLKELNPQLVITDIGLPDITGWKMLDSIKEHYTAIKRDLPAVIVVTAYGDPANRLIGKLQNIHSYLVKPFTPDQVERAVNMVISGERPADPHIDEELS